MSDQRQARTGVKGPGQSSDELLGVAQVFLVPSAEILQDKAAEGVGTLSGAYPPDPDTLTWLGGLRFAAVSC